MDANDKAGLIRAIAGILKLKRGGFNRLSKNAINFYENNFSKKASFINMEKKNKI